MSAPKRLLIAVLALPLAGCLEVDQFPAWKRGQYAGKVDQMPYQVHFHGDRLAWNAAIQNRNIHQNEYNRARPPKATQSLREMPRALSEPPIAEQRGLSVAENPQPYPAPPSAPPVSTDTRQTTPAPLAGKESP